MTTLQLAIEQLRCESVFAEPAPDGEVRTIRVADVLYLPDLLLQVVAGSVVPLEAVQDPWSLKFELGRNFQGKADRYQSPVEVDHDDRDVCILANFYSRNFFHCITEELVKVVILEASGFTGSYVVSRLPPFAAQFLAMLGVGPGRIIGPLDHPTRFRSAAYTTAITARQLDLYPDAFHAVRKALVEASGAGISAPSRRLWMDRKLGVNNPGRELLNPEQIYPLLDRYGFEIVDMAAFPVLEQIRMANQAAVLSGPHGAGFIHAMFMQPRSSVIECFSPLFINPGIFEVCRLLKHRYFMVAYENCYEGYQHGNRLMVNPSQLELALQSLD